MCPLDQPPCRLTVVVLAFRTCRGEADAAVARAAGDVNAVICRSFWLPPPPLRSRSPCAAALALTMADPTLSWKVKPGARLGIGRRSPPPLLPILAEAGQDVAGSE